MVKIYLLSLGCPRNMTDSEVLLSLLEEAGCTITDDPSIADVAIVNTCGFIQDAKQESIDVILRLAELKNEGKIKKLVVAGCLSQRYPQELLKEVNEIDGIFGTSDFTKIPAMIDILLSGKKIKEVCADPDFLYDETYARKSLTPPHYAYIKIQEGCSNRCSYCVIPDLKGKRRSRRDDSIMKEIKALASTGKVREFILIGQDTTSYGMDVTGKSELPDLLKKVSGVSGDAWVRLLYTHPAHFTDDLINVIADTPNICKYVDLPIQHINDRILKAMNRPVTQEEIRNLISRLRERIKGVTLRTSVIVGFPGETEEEFDELFAFLEGVKFERLGAFIYSREDGSPAAEMDNQIPEKVKKDRFDRVMSLQQRISQDNNSTLIGTTVSVLIDENESDEHFVGRSFMDAPEVDGGIFVKGEGISPGDIVDVKITGALEYDLMGEAV